MTDETNDISLLVIKILTILVLEAKMPELNTSIDIDAPPDAVWSVFYDFDQYADWNPFIRSLEGPTEVGDEFEVALELPGGRGMRR